MLQKHIERLVAAGEYDLVPLYACQLPSLARREVYTSFLDLLTEHPLTVCGRVHSEADSWFTDAFRQGLGDIEECELHGIVQEVRVHWPLM